MPLITLGLELITLHTGCIVDIVKLGIFKAHANR
jgi:hypothetical protein